MNEILSLFFIGFLASGIGSLVGLGGGFLIVPGLTLLFGFPMKVAIIFSLSSVILISILRNLQGREFIAGHRKTLRPLILSAILGAGLSAFLGRDLSNESLEALFGGFMIVAGTYFLLDPQNPWRFPKWISEHRVAQSFIFVGGGLGGLLGIGGGIVTVPTLHYVLRYSMSESAQLAFLFNFVTGAVALLIHVNTHRELLDQVSFFSLIVLLISSVVGMYAFSRLKVSQRNLKRIFSVAVIALGVFKIMKAYSFAGL